MFAFFAANVVASCAVQAVPMIKWGELDSEQQFVSTDGLFGEAAWGMAHQTPILSKKHQHLLCSPKFE